MIWGWENSWFFFLLGTLVLLLLLYWLRYRGKTFFTQALFLWDEDLPEEKSSSRIVFRSLPLSFYLEAAAIVSMVCGGASLFVVSKEEFPPAVVLLNNSYSMTSRLRRSGEKELNGYLKKFPGRRVIPVLCGSEPEMVTLKGGKADLAKVWRGGETEFNASKAVAWAKANFPGAEICLVTDRIPRNHIPGGITLISCGTPGENAAIVNAAYQDGRILLEIGSFSDKAMEIDLKVNGRSLEKFSLESNGRKIFNFTFGEKSRILKFRIDSSCDALEYDNEVTLIDPGRKAVSYRLGKLTPPEKRILEQLLDRDPEFQKSDGACELLFTGQEEAKAFFPGNRVLFHRGKKTVREKTPPFFTPQEPLLSGLYNTALVWAFAPGVQLPGKGMIFSSSGALMSMERKKERKFELHFNLVPEHSNIADLPIWPAFFCNLAELCRRSRPGIVTPNVRSGEMIRFNLSPGSVKLRCTAPDGTKELAGVDGRMIFRLKRCGIHTLDDGKIRAVVSVNPCVTDLSDLRSCRSLKAFSREALSCGTGSRRLGGIFIAAATFLLMLNGFLLGGKERKR